MRRLLCLIVLLALAGLAGAQDFIRYYPPAGAAGLTSSGTALTSTVPLKLPDGSASAPALTFTSTPMGLYEVSNTLFVTYSTTPVTGIGPHIKLRSSDSIQWSNGASPLSGMDTFLLRDAANTLAQKNANADQFFRIYGANGGYWERGVNSELLTIAAAATTDTTGNLLPANAIIEAVVVRVTTIIPTAATFTVGDATTAARFATGVSVAADTTAVGLLHRNPDVAAAAGPVQTTAAKIRITPNAQPAAATGVVRIEVFFSRFVAPTS